MEASAILVKSYFRGMGIGCIVTVDGNIYLKESKKKKIKHLFKKPKKMKLK